MNKSKVIFEKLGKLVEQTVINYKDLSSEIVNICKSKRKARKENWFTWKKKN